jgi:hypothetical protein
MWFKHKMAAGLITFILILLRLLDVNKGAILNFDNMVNTGSNFKHYFWLALIVECNGSATLILKQYGGHER